MSCRSPQVAPDTVTFSIYFLAMIRENWKWFQWKQEETSYTIYIFRSSVAKREPTFLPFISQVMCGAGCAFDVVQLADSFSPTVNWRLLNVMRGGPVCCAENNRYRRFHHLLDRSARYVCVCIERTYNMHLFHIRFLGEDWGVSWHLTMVRTGCIKVNIFQLQLLFVGIFPLCARNGTMMEKKNREEYRFLTSCG